MSDIDYAKEYDNSGRVDNAADLIDSYMLDAAFFRETYAANMEADLVYGPEERNMMDIFWPLQNSGPDSAETESEPNNEIPAHDKTVPIAMFIHGGYWQRLDRSSFSHMAGGLLAHGIAVAIPSYTLCPENTVEGIINEMRRACLVLYQTYERPITVFGHSAGGHLAACLLATDWDAIHRDLPENLVQSGMGISGLYDLTPLLQTPINDALGMDEETAKRASPVLWTPDALNRFEAWVGGDESGEYHRQSRELSQQWSLLGTPTEYVSAQGQNHFTIIDALTDPNSTMVRSIADMVHYPMIDVALPDLSEAEPDNPEDLAEPDHIIEEPEDLENEVDPDAVHDPEETLKPELLDGSQSEEAAEIEAEPEAEPDPVTSHQDEHQQRHDDPEHDARPVEERQG